VADPDELRLVAVPEAEPMVRARGSEKRDRDGGREEGDNEHVALELRHARPARCERDGEEEREQHGDGRQDDAQLVQELDPLAVGPLLRRLRLLWRALVVHERALLPRAAGVKALPQIGRTMLTIGLTAR